MTQSTELLPCPFCGGEAEYTTNQFYGDESMAQCTRCGARAFWRKWNARIEHSTPDRNAVLEEAASRAEEYPTLETWVPAIPCIRGIAQAIRALKTTTPEPTDPAGVAGVEKLLTLIETAHEHGDECAIIEQAAKVRAALRPARDKTRAALQAIKEGEAR